MIAIIISKFFVVMCLNEKVDKFVVRFNQEVFSIDLAKITNYMSPPNVKFNKGLRGNLCFLIVGSLQFFKLSFFVT